MIEFVPDVVAILFPVLVGLVTAFLFKRNRKSGFALISAAFIISAIPAIVTLALGGPYFIVRLRTQGYTLEQIGVVSAYLFIVRSAFQAAFVILVILGLIKLSK
ncbi:MAG TPA: hypothetical protein VJ249_01115 [Candidatus Bathyarchaeia archaeon]|nr:hypothetical protein [Candidatus Bathyarchaeia archaeon]